MRVRFGDFVFDAERRELRDRDRPVHLTPKAFELLRTLIEARPKAISQSQLYDALWPDTFVQTTNLHNLVRELRNALHDHDHKIIRTNYGFGFSFGADAFSADGIAPVAHVFVADQTFTLHEGENVVGRAPTATVQIDSSSVSRIDARITIKADVAHNRSEYRYARLKAESGSLWRRAEAAPMLTDNDLWEAIQNHKVAWRYFVNVFLQHFPAPHAR